MASFHRGLGGTGDGVQGLQTRGVLGVLNDPPVQPEGSSGQAGLL